jgi:hypothetical protein
MLQADSSKVPTMTAIENLRNGFSPWNNKTTTTGRELSKGGRGCYLTFIARVIYRKGL